MKHSLMAAAILWAATTALVPAQVITTNSYSLSPGAGIPDGSPVGLLQQFSVSSLAGSITNVQVQMNITGGFNGDLYAYLVNPQGQLSVLLNRVGVTGSNPFGYGDSGMNLTLDGLAANNIHSYASGGPGTYSLSGTTWAADGRNIDPQAAGSVFNTAATDANLSIYQNSAPNGVWTFFIADLSSGGGSATLNNVVLTIMSVPEPQPWLIWGGGLAVMFLGQRGRYSPGEAV